MGPTEKLDLKQRTQFQKSPMGCLSGLSISTNQDEALSTNQDTALPTSRVDGFFSLCKQGLPTAWGGN